MEAFTIRKPADVSETDARTMIGQRFAGYSIKSFKTEIDPSGQSFYSALIVKADHPQAGLPDAPMLPDPMAPDATSDSDPEADTPEPEEKPKEEHSKIKELEGKLDHLLDLVEKMTGGDDSKAKDVDLPETGAANHDLPAPAKEPIGPAAGGPGQLFAKRLAGRVTATVVRDNSANVKIATAKAELDAEFNPHGFKVVKMVRHDDKIVAGLVRSSD